MASSLSRRARAARLLYIALSLAQVLYATDNDVFCNAGVYGNPISIQCIGVLATFPIHDTDVRYFVEQQLRTAPPQAVWNAFKDPRPPSEAQAIVPLPKRVSFGQPVPQLNLQPGVLLLWATPANDWLKADAMLGSLASQNLSRKMENSATLHPNLHGQTYSARDSNWTMSALPKRKVEQS